MSEFLVRCSSIGKLMADPKAADLDPDLVTAEVATILAKRKRTDEEDAVLQEVRNKSLCAGGKTHVRELLREDIYGFTVPEVTSRPILKGRQVEAECIALLARLTGRPLAKNTERRNNGLLSGECDVYDAPERHGRDVKAPFSMATMPLLLADCYDSDYEYQMRGYMSAGLWDAAKWSVDYVLVNTPDELVAPDPISIHYVGHIAEGHRWTSWVVHRDLAIEALMFEKVRAARRYYRWALNEFDRTHNGRLPEIPPPTEKASRVTPAAPSAAPAAAPSAPARTKLQALVF